MTSPPTAPRTRPTRRDLITGVVASVLVVGLGTLFVVTALQMARWSYESLGFGDAAPATDAVGVAPPVVGPLPPAASGRADSGGAVGPGTLEAPRTTSADPPAAANGDGAVPTISAAAPRLALPVDGVEPDDLHQSFDEARGTRRHEAIDIMAPRGTVIRAAADGRVAKLFTSDAGGLTIYQFDRGERIAYYYAHLDRYRDGLAEGDDLRRGDVVGYVGSTGNAAEDAPHLHFAVFELGPEKRWWEGRPIDPYPLLRPPPS